MSAEFDDGKDDGALRTIGEVSKALAIKAHVLRYWEQQFPMLEPLKRSGGRRYYRPEDVQLVERIDALVNDQGYTLKGAKIVIEDDAAPAEKSAGAASEAETPSEPAAQAETASAAPEEAPAFKAPPVVGDTPIAQDGGLSNFFGEGAPAVGEVAAEEQATEQASEAAPEPAHSQTPAEPQSDPQMVPREDIVARLKSIHRTLEEAIGA